MKYVHLIKLVLSYRSTNSMFEMNGSYNLIMSKCSMNLTSRSKLDTTDIVDLQVNEDAKNKNQHSFGNKTQRKYAKI